MGTTGGGRVEARADDARHDRNRDAPGKLDAAGVTMDDMNSASPNVDQLAHRIQLLEAYISHLYQVTGVVMPPVEQMLPGVGGGPSPILLEIQNQARGGDMIGAIKRYREFSGAGLVEAKAAVEAMR